MVPYWQAGEAYLPYSHGYFAGASGLAWVLQSPAGIGGDGGHYGGGAHGIGGFDGAGGHHGGGFDGGGFDGGGFDGGGFDGGGGG